MGLYFEEWMEDKEYISPGRTITEAEVINFAAYSGDYNEIHTNEEFAGNTFFGKRMVHGLYGLAISHGLIFRLGILEGTAIAFLGLDNWTFKNPLFIGETVKVRVKVIEKRLSNSKNDRGIIKLFVQLIKNNEVVVQEGIKTLMMRKKDIYDS